MDESPLSHHLPTLLTGADGLSCWATRNWPIEARGGMLLSPRIDCSSLRLRRSEPGYASDWHVAGEPTLIVVQSGALCIILRDGSSREFGAGEAFIAADALPDGHTFDPALHGHRAEVMGDESLEAIHIKLTPLAG